MVSVVTPIHYQHCQGKRVTIMGNSTKGKSKNIRFHVEVDCKPVFSIQLKINSVLISLSSLLYGILILRIALLFVCKNFDIFLSGLENARMHLKKSNVISAQFLHRFILNVIFT